MNDPGLSAGSQDAIRFPQQSQWVLDMEDVEKHRATGFFIWQTATVGYKVPHDPHDVGQPDRFCLADSFRNHIWVYVQGDDSPRDQLCGWNGERAITTAELDDIPARTRAVKFLHNSARLEERVPVGLVRHPALPPMADPPGRLARRSSGGERTQASCSFRA